MALSSDERNLLIEAIFSGSFVVFSPTGSRRYPANAESFIAVRDLTDDQVRLGLTHYQAATDRDNQARIDQLTAELNSLKKPVA